MNCPNCGKAGLQQDEPAPGLVAYKCGKCKGRWIPGSYYLAWIEKNGHNLPEKEAPGESALRAVETGKARVCPECHCIMTRHEVGHGVNFSIDRCAACGGFWLDAGEFEALQRRNLHDDIHFVFSEAWQQHRQHLRAGAMYEQRMKSTLGETDYKKAKAFRDWLGSHPKRAAILAYLTYK